MINPAARRILWSLVDMFTPPQPPRPKLTVTEAAGLVKDFLHDPEGPLAQGDVESLQQAVGFLFGDAPNYCDDSFEFLHNLRLVKGTSYQYQLTALGQRVLANIEKSA